MFGNKQGRTILHQQQGLNAVCCHCVPGAFHFALKQAEGLTDGTSPVERRNHQWVLDGTVEIESGFHAGCYFPGRSTTC
jgi:hypothetical protein